MTLQRFFGLFSILEGLRGQIVREKNCVLLSTLAFFWLGLLLRPF